MQYCQPEIHAQLKLSNNLVVKQKICLNILTLGINGRYCSRNHLWIFAFRGTIRQSIQMFAGKIPSSKSNHPATFSCTCRHPDYERIFQQLHSTQTQHTRALKELGLKVDSALLTCVLKGISTTIHLQR